MKGLQDIKTWLLLQARSQRKSRVRKGFTVLFDGPSPAGKLTTAQALATEFGKELYRVDLSQVISKYIGETEKNLRNLFQQAEGKDWVLFFEKGNALFRKRSKVRDSHDRYANREIKFILEKLEDYPSLVILSTNLKANTEHAFMRRFRSVVCFSKEWSRCRPFHPYENIRPDIISRAYLAFQ